MVVIIARLALPLRLTKCPSQERDHWWSFRLTFKPGECVIQCATEHLVLPGRERERSLVVFSVLPGSKKQGVLSDSGKGL